MAAAAPFRLGLISDTHGLLRAAALDALRGCDALIHAGDIGDAAILDALRELAPLSAVRGNNDTGAWAARLPETADLEHAGVRIHVLHDLKALRMPSPQPQLIVAGHSHRPRIETRDGLLYVNPGSAGPRRFRLPVSVAVVEFGRPVLQARLIDLA